MALGDIKYFTINESGFVLSVEAIDLGSGQTQFNITSIAGQGDLNAIWWSDGDSTVEGDIVLLKSDNSLNMNGTGIVWDGYEKLSDTGLGKIGEAKATFITEGETLSFLADASWIDVLTLGIRATSVNGGGSIKGVDQSVDQTISLPTISISDVTVAEGDTAEFTISLTNAYPYDIKVYYETQDDSAADGSDYSSASGFVTIPAGQTEVTVNISTLNDQIYEGTETFTVKLSNANADIPGPDLPVSIADDTATGTITDEADIPTASIAVAPASVTEDGAGNLVFTVTLSNASAFDTTINYSIGGSATNGTDYATLTGTVTIPAGQTSATITVDPTSDNLFEADEEVTLTLTDGSTGGQAIHIDSVDDTATGTITDDADIPTASIAVAPASVTEDGTENLVFTVTLSNASAFDTTVNYSIGGSATNGTDYAALTGTVTIPAGQTSATIAVDPISDDIAEGDEEVTLTLTGGSTNGQAINIDAVNNAATGTIVDDDPVIPVNQSPVANDDIIIVSSSQLSLTTFQMPVSWLLANDSDADGDPLSISVSDFSVVGANNGWTVTPHDDGMGRIDYFTVISPVDPAATSSWLYTVSDGQGGTDTATVTFKSVGTNNGRDTINLGAQGSYDFAYIDLKIHRDTGMSGPEFDVWNGGPGSDLFVIGADDGNTVILDFKAGDGTYLTSGGGDGENDGDLIDISAFGFDDLASLLETATDNVDTGGFGVGVKLQLDVDTSVTLINVTSADLNPNDFLFA